MGVARLTTSTVVIHFKLVATLFRAPPPQGWRLRRGWTTGLATGSTASRASSSARSRCPPSWPTPSSAPGARHCCHLFAQNVVQTFCTNNPYLTSPFVKNATVCIPILCEKLLLWLYYLESIRSEFHISSPVPASVAYVYSAPPLKLKQSGWFGAQRPARCFCYLELRKQTEYKSSWIVFDQFGLKLRREFAIFGTNIFSPTHNSGVLYRTCVWI